MASNLHHAVGRCVNDRLFGAKMFFPQLLNNYSARSRFGAENPNTKGIFQVADQILWEPLGIRGKTALQYDPHHFPMSRSGILATSGKHPPAPGTPGIGNRRYPLNGNDIAKAQGFHMGQRKSAYGLGNMPQCITFGIIKILPIRQGTDADAVQYN